MQNELVFDSSCFKRTAQEVTPLRRIDAVSPKRIGNVGTLCAKPATAIPPPLPMTRARAASNTDDCCSIVLSNGSFAAMGTH